MTHANEVPERGGISQFVDALFGAAEWLIRLIVGLLRAPFQRLPPQYGSTMPPDLARFEAEAAEAQRHPRVTTVPGVRHARTHPARQDESLEHE